MRFGKRGFETGATERALGGLGGLKKRFNENVSVRRLQRDRPKIQPST